MKVKIFKTTNLTLPTKIVDRFSNKRPFTETNHIAISVRIISQMRDFRYNGVLPSYESIALLVGFSRDVESLVLKIFG